VTERLVHNRFKLLKRRGSGGTGEVYQAFDTRLKRKVALKRVRRDPQADRMVYVRRLLREAETLALVEHPNVVTIHDVIEQDDSVSIVMELVEGIPLGELYRRGPIQEKELLGYLRQLVAALEHVHAARIVHRDVNPRNVLVTPDGNLKLTDFGLATSLDDPQPRAGGSIGYMAPEALRRGGRIGFGVDIFGTGMVTYQALLGGPTFQQLYGAPEPSAWARWLLSREAFKTLQELGAPVSPALSAAVERMLEKDPSRRYQRMADVQKDLETLGEPPPGGPGTPRGPSLASAVRRLLPTLLARPSQGT
jgi:serine/threonine-protein kinase